MKSKLGAILLASGILATRAHASVSIPVRVAAVRAASLRGPGAGSCGAAGRVGAVTSAAAAPGQSRPDQRNRQTVREIPFDAAIDEKPQRDHRRFERTCQGCRRNLVAHGEARLDGDGTRDMSGLGQRRAGLQDGVGYIVQGQGFQGRQEPEQRFGGNLFCENPDSRPHPEAGRLPDRSLCHPRAVPVVPGFNAMSDLPTARLRCLHDVWHLSGQCITPSHPVLPE